MPSMNQASQNGVSKKQRKRRATIPERQNSNFTLWSMLKSFIGKDLSKIPMPVNYNEPLSMLQRVTEDLDYSAVLDLAADVPDSAGQMSLVAGFTVAFYAVQHERVGKPFNPLLGETFECDRWDELGWRSVAEQNTGDMTVIDHTTGDKCFFHFSSYNNGIFSREQHHEPNKVVGVVVNSVGEAKWVLKGRWEEHMDRAPVIGDGGKGPITDEKGAFKAFEKLKVGTWSSIWARKEPMPNYEDVYHMSRMAVTLNEAEDGVAPTDSRLRPDQRRMEEGDWDGANTEKVRLEEKQREKRKKSKSGQEEGGGVWFREEEDADSGSPYWRYAGDYWAAKAEQDWTRCPDIF